MAITQLSVIKEYTEKYIKDFNPNLFVRSDDLIIENLKKVILSCQRDYGFTLRVEGFTVIDDYQQIKDTLYNFDEQYNIKKRNKKNPNPYQFISINDSDLRLLIVRYYIQVKDKFEYVNVIIAVPRVINEYYFRINGKVCFAQYQISDITYNNATSNNNKFPRVTLRTIFMPIKIFKKKYKLNTFTKEEVVASYYISKIFNKMFGVCKYILAKLGVLEAIRFMGYEQFMFISDHLHEHADNYYVFEKHNIFIYVDRMVFNNDDVLQSLVYNIYQSIYKDTKYCNFFSHDYWLKSLGREFNIDNEEKGVQVLLSLEGLYDIRTKEILRLPDEDKDTIYHLLRWMIRDFNSLMNKSNMNLAFKRIKCEEYIAALYAAKISTGLYRVTNSNKKGRMTINSIKKAVCTLPLYLVSAISKCNLVNYRDLVNDLDSLVLLDATFNGPSGLDDSMGSISNSMRHVDVSHIGRLDLSSSKKSSPGINISLVPTCEVDEDGYFSVFEEPNTWRERTAEVMEAAKNLQGLHDVIAFEQDVLGLDRNDELKNVESLNTMMANLIEPIYFIENGYKDINLLTIAGEQGIIMTDEDVEEE